MQALYIDQPFTYDGSQLKSLFAYMNHGVLGDSIVAWQGPCDVDFSHMLDGEDLRAQSPIRGGLMTHFIVEMFGMNLFSGVAVQRLVTSMAIDVLRNLSPLTERAQALRRDGDDIFGLGDDDQRGQREGQCEGKKCDRKLSISIATVSPVSALVHFAVNVTNEGTPVKTLALRDLEVDPQVFAKALMGNFCAEILSIKAATCKVRPTTSY